ncbi:Hypothetical predicted protein, partial [Paramuricea clavata]
MTSSSKSILKTLTNSWKPTEKQIWSSQHSPQPTPASSSSYGVLEQLNRRVLYFDTDSVIYVSKEDEWEPPTGSYLGQLTDELDGGYITTFVSGGPKNYAYETSTDKTVCKVRGITLNYRTQQHVNFDVMSDMVRGEGPEKVT